MTDTRLKKCAGEQMMQLNSGLTGNEPESTQRVVSGLFAVADPLAFPSHIETHFLAGKFR